MDKTPIPSHGAHESLTTRPGAAIHKPSRLSQIIESTWTGPALIALLATLLVCFQVDPAGDYPSSGTGPGLTLDEIFNAQIGVELADPSLTGDFPKLIKASRILPDHPPLGRLCLGLAHEVCLLLDPPAGEHGRLVIACARVGSAVTFGLLVFIIGCVSTSWYGKLAGCASATSLILMPRVFGHAHLAALETPLNLTYAMAVLSVAWWWGQRNSAATLIQHPPKFRSALICGLCFGLALLTKIQAIFLPFPIFLWMVWNWRWRAVWPLFVWGVTGLLVFVAGWPWLWPNPLGNILSYLGHARERTTIYVWYLGQQFADRDVPWHYPWVLFATTVPATLHALGLWGTWSSFSNNSNATEQKSSALWEESSQAHRWRLRPQILVLGTIAFPLIAFSIPGTAVYDGERLFLIVYPLWALFIGKGFHSGFQWVSQRSSSWIAVLLTVAILSSQIHALHQFSPCWLSYYNELVGGLKGADQLGFQRTYWGDSITRDLLDRAAKHVPAESEIDFLPVQHGFQLPALESQCPHFRARGLRLRAFDENLPPAKFLIAFHRRDYWPQAWTENPPRYRLIVGVWRQNTLLAGLYQHESLPIQP